MRIGQGFDVHSFSDDRPLILCGVEIPDSPGLDGHSDADVALHAVADALFGAVAAGDLGDHFPPTDAVWRDAASKTFVHRALEIATESGFHLVNCDVTIIGEHPRVSAHRAAMRGRLAELLGLEIERVSIKATTTDGLGFTGRNEGLAAMAIVMLEGERDE